MPYSLTNNLPDTPWPLDRGNGLASIPNTGGNASGDHNSKPPSACFWTKPQVLDTRGLDYEAGKIFLGRVDQKMVGLADNRHIVTIAGSRGGKSVCSLIPNLMQWGGSALVLDPKGELARETAAIRATMGQKVLVLDPWNVSGVANDYPAKFNPLSGLIDADVETLIDDSNLIADALIIPNEKEPHFTDSGRALVQSLIMMIVLDDGESTLARLPLMLGEVAESEGAALTGFFPDDAPVEAHELIAAQGKIVMGMGDKERGPVISTCRAQLTFLDSPALAKALDSSAFSLRDLKREAATLYLCLPASRMGTHSRWLRLIVNLALAALEQEPAKPHLPVLFVLEEFAALGHMRSLENAVAYMAGFDVKLWAVLQDITQLKRHYPKSWETFLGNAGVLQAFSVADQSTLEYLSKRLGKTTLQITNQQDASADQMMKGDLGFRREFKECALLEADEIALKFARKSDGKGGSAGGLSLVLVSGVRPFIVDRVYFGELVNG